jgi:hypothetical protein
MASFGCISKAIDLVETALWGTVVDFQLELSMAHDEHHYSSSPNA